MAGIGDTLIATPLLRELRQSLPRSRIDVLVFWKGSKDLLAHNPNVDRIVQKNILSDDPQTLLRFFNELRREHYDISLNTHPQGRVEYRCVARAVGASLRVSHEYDHFSWWDRLLVNRTLPQDYGIHSVENNLRLLDLLDIRRTIEKPELELFLQAEERVWAANFVADHAINNQRCIGIHVGSGTTKNLRFKRWPLHNYASLVSRLVNRYQETPILLFGGPEEFSDNQLIANLAGGSKVWIPRTPSVRHAAALLEHCSVFLSVDNLMMHLAASVHVPTQIVIESPTFGPTVAPYRSSFTLVPNPITHGRGLEFYRYHGGDISGGPEFLIRCMNSITVDAVEQVINSAVEKSAPTLETGSTKPSS